MALTNIDNAIGDLSVKIVSVWEQPETRRDNERDG